MIARCTLKGAVGVGAGLVFSYREMEYDGIELGGGTGSYRNRGAWR